MKNMSHSNPITRPCLILAVAFGIWAPLEAQSDMPMNNKAPTAGKTTMQCPASKPAKGMMMDGKMMEAHQAMMADMKAQDAELVAQVAKMNSAPADKKLDLMAAIVTRMVEQRTAMTTRIGMMQGEMMKCSMQCMTPDANTPSQQPMMNGMGMNGEMGDAKK